MWIDTPESRELVSEISKEVVAEIAPEELEVADELLEDYYRDPTVFYRARLASAHSAWHSSFMYAIRLRSGGAGSYSA